MIVAERVRRLLDAHGHSYKQAAEVTGVSHETIRRIVMGHKPPRLRLYIRGIADGYGVDEVALLEGESPKGEFEWSINNAPLSQRLEWMLMTPAQRIKLALDFLFLRYPQIVPHRVLASALGVSCSFLIEALESWEVSPPDRVQAMEYAQAIHGLTGISLIWLKTGRLGGTAVPSTYLARFSTMAKQGGPASWTFDVAALVG